MVAKPKMVNKKPSLTKYNNGGTRNKTTKIAWHYTGAHDVKAINTINNWFNEIGKGMVVNGKYAYASSHFVMELDGTIYSYIPMNYIAWTTNAANYYSIGIECATTGSDDHYTDEEYKSMVKLGAWLAQEYNLDPRTDFIRHYDVTKKICPRYFVNHSSDWKQFKLDCYNYMKGKLKESNIRNCTNGKGNSILKEEFKPYVVRIICDTLNIRSGAGTDYEKTGELHKGDAYTIVEEKKSSSGSTWGKLKSGEGWISLGSKYVEKI